MAEIPLFVSVDDHVIEPPNVWQDRLPRKLRAAGPRVERRKIGDLTVVGGRHVETASDVERYADWWHYEDLLVPHRKVFVAAGLDRDAMNLEGITYDEMRPGCYDVEARLVDMDKGHMERSLCFPTFPRFCGQTFLEANDMELALLCVRAYNDWMVEEWCGSSGGRLIPNCLVPLWDAELAAGEVRRNAARGVRSVAFSEVPAYLGLPSIHDPGRFWDPFFAACAETSTVVSMHIGSSSRTSTTSDDAPYSISVALASLNAMVSMTDYLFSGVLVRFPELKLAYSEGQIGWIPFILERADQVWEDHSASTRVRDLVPEPPSTYYERQIYGCFFKDDHGIRSLDDIGTTHAMFETDYPHVDSTWPHSLEVAATLLDGLDDATIYAVVRGNAESLYGLAPLS